MNVGVFLPTELKSLAIVYLGMSGFVQMKQPWAPEPFAWTTRSGMRSRLKWAIFSKSRKSSKTTGPRGPTVSEFWLSPTGRPVFVVMMFFFSSAIDPPLSAGRLRARGHNVRRGHVYCPYRDLIHRIAIADRLRL